LRLQLTSERLLRDILACAKLCRRLTPKLPSTATVANGRDGEGFRMPACGDLSARAEGRRPKASQEGTRGGRVTACRLWGFDDAAVCVVDALAGVIGGGSTIAVASLAPARQSTGQF
jgi:hypothetical protein